MKNIFYFFLFYFIFCFNLSSKTQIVIDENEWPCETHHLYTPKQTDFWPQKNVSLNSEWKNDAEVKELVNFITNHANNINQGKKAIVSFSKKIEDKKIKAQKFDLIFSGVFQEMTLYLSIAKHGVFQFITRIELLEKELIKKN